MPPDQGSAFPLVADKALTTAISAAALAGLGDEAVMRRVQADDMLAFEELYRRYSASAFSIARVICHGPGLAEDAAQDGFVSFWRSRHSYEPDRGTVRAWLLQVVRHRSIDLMRAEKLGDAAVGLEEALALIAAPDSPAEDSERSEEAARVRSSLSRIPLFQREVITLAHFGGLTQSEIAHRLGVPIGTVKGRMRLGLLKVKDSLNGDERSSRSPTADIDFRS